MLKAVSLFSGCGGSDLGLIGGFSFLGKSYNKNPIDIVYALDNDAKAIKTYNQNFKHSGVVEDIKKVDISSIPDCDLIIGGFPCQSFSTVNPTKDPYDDRGMLYREMVKIVAAKKPKFFIAENVKGLARLHKGSLLRNVLMAFENEGYRTYHKIINAADYGVPQKRERVFIIGIRNDIEGTYNFPDSTHNEISEKKKKSWVGIKYVLEDLNKIDTKYYFSEKAVLGMKNAKNNMKRGLAQNPEEPSLTVTSHLAKVSLNSRDPVLLVDPDNEKYRRFTPKEAARIQSFPDTFTFCGSEGDAYRQIGNAIPPVVMWHIVQPLLNLR